uniref:Crumbs cell polarity complex component 2 n=1 Tax=Scleropages formosus TaxID=113540 RepID=A0A8C9V612_SCLFO
MLFLKVCAIGAPGCILIRVASFQPKGTAFAEMQGKCHSSPCRNGGTCESQGLDYVCHCPSGYQGRDCGTPNPYCVDEPCLNNGTCYANGGGYSCACLPGFQGPRCEEDLDECVSQPCRNGAICVDDAGAYRCFCVPGFQGYNCEIDIDECASRPCENNGTCVNGKDRYVCECMLGYTGENCEVEIDECESQPCQNGATCHDLVGRHTCDCLPGFEGLGCEVNIDECASQPCLNGGTCNDLVDSYDCNCRDTGFTGLTCGEEILECNSNPCQNNATCQEEINRYTCICWNGFEGEHCEVDVDECAARPCRNGGRCLQKSDVSAYGDPTDFNYANAAGYLCVCPPGFTGETCSEDVDDCKYLPCRNGGTCKDQTNAYQCLCLPGFTGVDCEVNIDECQSEPCQNGARCEDSVSGYKCRCPEAGPGEVPWGGDHCEVPLIGCRDHLCENGATCAPLLVEGQHSYICHCSPGFHGSHCSHATTFSFSRQSFVPLPALRPDRLPEVHLRFRTTLPDGVLFYRGDGDSYLTLEVTGGRLRAAVAIGNAEIYLSLPGLVHDSGWRDVHLVLNGSLRLELRSPGCGVTSCWAENGSATLHHLRVPASFSEAFVGGTELGYLGNTASQVGFVGCVQDLAIDSVPVLPQYFPEGSGVQMGCSKTDWCHSEPCSNRGRCVDRWTSFYCDCRRPFYGDRCEKEHPSWTFGHEDTVSYASYDIGGIPGARFAVSFLLRSRKRDGLLLQLRRKGAPYFTIYLQASEVHIRGPSHDQTLASILVATGEWCLLIMEARNGSIAFREGERSERSFTFLGVAAEAGDVAFVGGLPEGEDTEPWGGHFKGCLQDLRLFGEHLKVLNITAGARDLESADQVLTVSLKVELCKNGGRCRVTWNDFTCDCPSNFTGRRCERRVWCASDPCAAGSRCKDLPDGYECLSNATFENDGLQYKANGSLVDPVTRISMELRTREENGVILRAFSGAEFFCVGLLNSSLLVKIRTGNNVEALAFTSMQPLSDGDWHQVRVAMADPQQGSSRWMMAVDGERSGISLAAAGDLSFLNESTVYLAENFTGCLGEVRVGEVYLPFLSDGAPQSARFVRQGAEEVRLGCTGSPVCRPNPCLNNGTCEDLFDLFGCVCAPGWEGPRCQDDVDECASAPCVRGTCTDLLADFECKCPRGYGGKACEDDLDDCRGHSCMNGGSCVDGVDSYTCACPPNFTGLLCQWIFPSPRCEHDVQCENGATCTEAIWGANCTCAPGFTGDRCEVEVDECESNPCQHGGSCVDRLDGFQCVCMPGFAGSHCENSKQEQKEGLPLLVVAVPVACCCILLAAVGLAVMALTARRKRQSEGTYSPSQQEVAGARLEMDSVLKVPPEERLI